MLCVCVAYVLCIRTGGNLIWTRQLDRSGGGDLPIVPRKGPGLRLPNEFCRSAFPSRVRGACGPRDNSGHNRKAAAAGGCHSKRSRDRATPGGSSRPSAPQFRWHECSTAPRGEVEIRRFRVTHPYHPLFQQEFELVSYRQNWGEDRVWFQDKVGRLHSLPTSWTDVGAVDPFVAIAAGRSLFRVADLIELARQIDGWKPGRVEKTVKENLS